MSSCKYCYNEIIWVPSLEGVRPYNPPRVPMAPDAPVVLLCFHECEEREKALQKARREFSEDLRNDPLIRSYAMTLPCSACQADPNEDCKDLRKGFKGRKVKHPHQKRLIEGVKFLQEEGIRTKDD